MSAARNGKRGREEEHAQQSRNKQETDRDSGSESDDEDSSDDSDGDDEQPRTSNGRSTAQPNGRTANGHVIGSASKQGAHTEDDSSDDDDSDDSSSSDDDDTDPSIPSKPSSSSSSSTADLHLSDDSDSDSSSSSDSDVSDSELLKHVSSLTAGQHEDESDDEFALMRCDDPYPPMDWQNKARCLRFIKKTATNIKRVLMKKTVRRMRSVRHRYKDDGKTSKDAESDPSFLAAFAEYKMLEKYNIALLCELSWEFYWRKNKKVKFPPDPTLTPEMKAAVRVGLQHTMMRLAFQQIIKAHLHKLKRQARKIIKAVNRQERKDGKYDQMMRVNELTEMLREARQPARPPQSVEQLKIGQVVDAIVDNVTAMGVFVLFWRAGDEVRGLIHVSELSDEYTADVAGKFHVGDQLNPVIIAVDPVKHKVQLSMKASFYPDGVQPVITHLAEHMREAALQEKAARQDKEKVPQGVASVFLERIQKKIGLDDAALEKIRQFYATGAGAKVGKNRMGQKQRRRLAEEVLGWQRKLRKNERPLTKKQLKKARRKEEENLRKGIRPLTEAEKAEKRAFELAEKKARALRKYDKNKDRNKARKAEERQKREDKERQLKIARLQAKAGGVPWANKANGSAGGGGGSGGGVGAGGDAPNKRQRTE